MTSAVTTHVLDSASGRPAAGVPVSLSAADGSLLASGVTDSDGRLRSLGPASLEAGVYRLVFDIEAYHGPDAFYPKITVDFRIFEAGVHHHVPVLLSPFAYSTYRGS
ncbi:5-hydroxyisourate hydrolase [Kibdelosporangium banguiense]|uniref:5-hydroxyisourate hydrolase n=1 Tax=Kibdelosporangium banguiense TaxID=1365924 RepID=A0ABS4THG9_9PSEU|nr:hydroxyisourate hydrolase [Kibdelosporangium banguiense]MBP2323744.1 5-hydroxyisourate hydrolase [Kibdelosporangium banguiense]